MSDKVDKPLWWHTQNQDYLHGPCENREAAIEAGLGEYGAEKFYICEGRRFKYQPCHFDIDWIAENFDDANCEYGPEDDGPSVAWSDDACRELENALTATMAEWLDRHNYAAAWAIDARAHEEIDGAAEIAARDAGEPA